MNSVNNIDFERAVLSSILFDPSQLDDIVKELNHDDLYLPAHQKVFQVMTDLHRDDYPVDEEFVRKRLISKDVEDHVLIDILAANPITNTMAYVNEIKDGSTKRKLASLATSIKNFTQDENKNGLDALDQVKDKLHDIEKNHSANTSTFTSSSDIAKQMKLNMELASKQGGVVGQRTGFFELDRKIGAFEPGDLIIIAGRPSMGKSCLMQDLATNVLKDGRGLKGVLLESLEMPAEKCFRRFISAMSGEYLNNIKKGTVSNLQEFNKAVDFYSNDKNLIIEDKPATTKELLRRVDNMLAKNPHIKDVFIDHTGKIGLEGTKREDIQIGEITNGLKNLAKKHEARMYLLQQLNRGVESRDNKRPMLSDLKNSGNIEEDADIVLFVYRASYYKADKEGVMESPISEAEVIIAKNRDGELGTARLDFEGRCARFKNKVKITEMAVN